MKVRDLQLYLRYSLSKDILLSFVRSNFLGLFLIIETSSFNPSFVFADTNIISSNECIEEIFSIKGKNLFLLST